jgi:hypothetical protein
MWTCPECGRKFARNKQSHSCTQYDQNLFFKGRVPAMVELCNDLIYRVKQFGEVEVYTGKWNLTLRHYSTFLSIIIEKSHLTLVFISEEPIDEFPVYQTHHHTSSRFSNLVKIESLDEIDDQLMNWLKRAWELAV